jgi:hypothetical protein
MGCIENDDDLEGLEQLDISRTTDADPPDIKVSAGICITWWAGVELAVQAIYCAM